MFLEDQNKTIDISNKVINWLNSKAKEHSFSDLLNIFLLGQTLKEGFGYVLTYQEIVDSFVSLPNRKFIKPKKNVIEIIPPPTPDVLSLASKELEKIGIQNSEILIKDLYLESPRKALKDYLIFVLGE